MMIVLAVVLLRRRHMQRQAAAIRGSCLLHQLPRTTWQLGEGRRYACFLSHYKSECASTARILHDQLQLILGCDIFLDSSNLTDLNDLFDNGLRKADVILLLCTENVLSRPWVLLELFEAHRRKIPVVPVQIPQPGQSEWTVQRALQTLDDLKASLESRAPGAFAEVAQHLRQCNSTADELCGALQEVLLGRSATFLQPEACEKEVSATEASSKMSSPDISESEMSESEMSASEMSASVITTPSISHCSPNVKWDPCASDRLMVASTKEVCEQMAYACKRKISWETPSTNKGRLCCRSRSNSSSANSTSRLWLPGLVTGTKSIGKAQDQSYGFFISYYRAETGPDARLLHSVLEAEMCEEDVFLDATDATDLKGILCSLHRSRALLLVLSARVLERPWVLLEVYEALTLNLPIVCVNIAGGGYAFDKAAAYLANIETELEQRDPSAMHELREKLCKRGVSLADLQARLSARIPSIIAVPFDPANSCSEHHLQAVAHELIDRRTVATKRFVDAA